MLKKILATGSNSKNFEVLHVLLQSPPYMYNVKIVVPGSKFRYLHVPVQVHVLLKKRYLKVHV